MKKLITILLIVFVNNSGICQIEATTKDGKKVTLNSDGTWTYAEVSKRASISLECSDLIETITDKVTGRKTISNKVTLIISKEGGKKGFGIIIMDVSNTLVIRIQAVGAGGCIDDDNKMNVLFRDGTRLELINNTKFNCDSEFILYFGGSFGKKKELDLFRTKEIETMRIWTSKSYVEEDFTSEQSQEFMKTIDCLVSG